MRGRGWPLTLRNCSTGSALAAAPVRDRYRGRSRRLTNTSANHDPPPASAAAEPFDEHLREGATPGWQARRRAFQATAEIRWLDAPNGSQETPKITSRRGSPPCGSPPAPVGGGGRRGKAGARRISRSVPLTRQWLVLALPPARWGTPIFSVGIARGVDHPARDAANCRLRSRAVASAKRIAMRPRAAV
jgi:hypothetical protein